MLKFLAFLKQQGPAEISKTECIASLRRVMPLAMSYLVGQHYYKQNDSNDAVIGQMFQQLKSKFSEKLQTNRLQLSAPIVQLMVQKIEAMTLQIGVTPRNMSLDFFEDASANQLQKGAVTVG